MTYKIGPHQRAGRRRRRGKAAVLCAVMAALALSMSWRMWDKPTAPVRRMPDRTYLGWMINRAALSPWDARAYAKQYPELSDLFLNASVGPAP